MEELERCFRQRELNPLLLCDPVLKILKPKLIGSLQGPVTAPIETTNQLEAIRRVMKLLQEAGFIAGEFDAQKLLECDHDQVINAGKSLFEKLIPLTGRSGSIDQAIISTKEGCQTGSSQYASAESEADSTDSIDIQRMSLGPSGEVFIRNKTLQAEMETQSTNIPMAQGANQIGPGQLHACFMAAMKKYEEDQRTFARQNANRSRIINTTQDIPPADVEMESIGSNHSRSNNYDSHDPILEDLRRPLVAAAEVTPNGGFTPQRIRISAIADLKEFTGRDQDEDRARSWISRVKSAFLRDQAPDTEKCLVFSDLLTGPARNWYNQLSRSTRHDCKSLLECLMIQYGGYGVSAGRQCYHARKQSNETPLEYLY